MTFVRCFVSWTWCHGWCALARGAGGMKDGGDTFLPRHPFLPQRAARSTSRCSDLLIVGPSLHFTVLGPSFHFTRVLCLVVPPSLYCVSSCSPYTVRWHPARWRAPVTIGRVAGYAYRVYSAFVRSPALARIDNIWPNVKNSTRVTELSAELPMQLPTPSSQNPVRPLAGAARPRTVPTS